MVSSRGRGQAKLCSSRMGSRFACRGDRYGGTGVSFYSGWPAPPAFLFGSLTWTRSFCVDCVICSGWKKIMPPNSKNGLGPDRGTGQRKSSGTCSRRIGTASESQTREKVCPMPCRKAGGRNIGKRNNRWPGTMQAWPSRPSRRRLERSNATKRSEPCHPQLDGEPSNAKPVWHQTPEQHSNRRHR